MILMIENDMPVSTMARAGITATEGITAAMQDLGLACNGLKASGSVKQDIVIVRNRSSDLYLRGAGNHCKLGELIGRAAIGSTRSSASMHHVNMTSRCSIVGRMSEYGYDQDILFGLSGDPDFSHFLMCLLDRDSDPKAVATVSAALYVIDLINWGFTAEDAGKKVLEELLRSGLTEPVISSSPRETLACTVARFLSG